MKLDSETGLLDMARQVLSPNADDRPDGMPIDLLVIHNISLPPGEFGGPWIDELFCHRLDPDAHEYFRVICDMQVSCHFLIRRDGELVQYVPVQQRAWHTGQSSYQERQGCNDFSIGIELEGSDDIPYEDTQYQVLNELISALTEVYPALASNIVGHSDIAPGRKTDPGPAFDWERLKSLIES